MGALTSRQSAAIEETDNVANHAYKYPPRNGKNTWKFSLFISFSIYFLVVLEFFLYNFHLVEVLLNTNFLQEVISPVTSLWVVRGLIPHNRKRIYSVKMQIWIFLVQNQLQ